MATAVSAVVVVASVLVVAPWRPSAGVELRMSVRELWPGGLARTVATMVSSAMLAAALLIGISLEHEVRTGNARLVEATGTDFFVVQQGARDWINSSFLSSADLRFMQEQPGTNAWGTQRFFASDHGDDLFVVSYSGPDSAFAPRVEAGRLATGPTEVVADRQLDRELGATIRVAGRAFRIVGLTSGTSSLGKLSVFLPEPAVRAITKTDGYTVLGVRRDGGRRPPAPAGSEVLTSSEFIAGNEGFWRRNGTLIVTSLLVAIVVLSVVNASAAKRAELALARRANATMLAVGASRHVIVAKELMKAELRAISGILPGVGLAVLALRSLNGVVDGLAASVTADFVLWASALVLAIPMVAILVSTVQFRRTPLVQLLTDE